MTDAPMTDSVRDNAPASRFELETHGGIALAYYRRMPGAIVFTHTETPRHLQGRGIASRLMKGALAQARSDNLKIVAGCSFVADYLRRHPDEAV